MLQRLTNYNNIRKINCRPVSHEIPPASLMAQPNMPACPLTKKPPSHATSTPLSRRATFNFESDFNSSSSTISDISTTEDSESEQSTVIMMSPTLVTTVEGKIKLRDIDGQVNPTVNKQQHVSNSCRSTNSTTLKSSSIMKKQDVSAPKVGETKKELKKIRFNIPPEDPSIPAKCESFKTARIREMFLRPEDINNVTAGRPTSYSQQLLHPDWRKVPWKDYFGWTEAHDTLMKKLKTEMTNGESIYYRDEAEYEASRKYWVDAEDREEFLGGPSVTSVLEMLEVMREKRDKGSFSYVPKRSPRRRSGQNASHYESESE